MKFFGSKSPGAPLGRLASFFVFCCAAFGRHCLVDKLAPYAPDVFQKCCLSAACKPVRPRRLLLAAVWAAPFFCPFGGGGRGVEGFARFACLSASCRFRLVKSCYCLACPSISLVCVCVCGCLCPCLVHVRCQSQFCIQTARVFLAFD